MQTIQIMGLDCDPFLCNLVIFMKNVFFRENIEGEYIWGDKGIQVNEDLTVDFKVQTSLGSERIARTAFDYA